MQMRRAAERGETTAALRSYSSHVRARGDSDPDALAGIALAVIRRAAGSSDAAERSAGFVTLRSLGVHAREELDALARMPGVVGDRAVAVLFDLDRREGPPPARLFIAARSDDPERIVAGLAAYEVSHDTRALLAALASISPDVRRAAASRIAREHSPEVAQALSDHALHDPDELVRMAAINALGQQGLAGAPALEQVLSEGTETSLRMSALSALSQASPARAEAALTSLLAHPPTSLSLEAARVLAQQGNASAAGYILSALEDPHPEVRAQAAVGAASLRDSHVNELAPHIEDADVEVQLRVAGLLVRDPRFRPRVIRALRPVSRRPDPFVAIRALGVLAEAGDATAANPLRGALRSRDTTVRRLGVLAWSRLAETSGEVDPLAPLLEDPDRSVRLMAAGEIVRVAMK
jgi:HEAT repeat protein